MNYEEREAVPGGWDSTATGPMAWIPSRADQAAMQVRVGAARRAQPALDALDARHAALTDPTRRNAFTALADRGFYGGLAEQNVRTALGDLASDINNQRQTITNAALEQSQADVRDRQTLDYQGEQDRLMREAARPRRFLGIF